MKWSKFLALHADMHAAAAPSLPCSRWMGWSAVATAAAALSGFLIPWEVAFVPPAELYSFGSPWAALNLLMVSEAFLLRGTSRPPCCCLTMPH